MHVYELIKKKRDGSELSKGEIEFLINGYLNGRIPDYQMSAFLMAVYFKGMSSRECVDLTAIMTQSGDQINLSAIEGFKVDKHSTGGVGDTTTLVLAPLVAACGGMVAKMTGRELGHTGKVLAYGDPSGGRRHVAAEATCIEQLETGSTRRSAATGRTASATRCRATSPGSPRSPAGC